MKYYVEFIGDAAKIVPMPHDYYYEKIGIDTGDGLTYEQACDRVAEHYEQLAHQYRMRTMQMTQAKNWISKSMENS